MEILSVEAIDKLIEELPDEAIEANLKDRHFKKFIKAQIIFLSQQVEKPVGTCALWDYFLNMRTSDGKPIEMDMRFTFTCKERPERNEG